MDWMSLLCVAIVIAFYTGAALAVVLFAMNRPTTRARQPRDVGEPGSEHAADAPYPRYYE